MSPTSSYSKDDVPLAIALTIGAGLATTIGAALSFWLTHHFENALAIALAFSAGVMIYVSFLEIIPEGLLAFEEELQDSHPNDYEAFAHFYLSLSFFGGIAIGYLIDAAVHALGYTHEMSVISTPIHTKPNPNIELANQSKSVQEPEEISNDTSPVLEPLSPNSKPINSPSCNSEPGPNYAQIKVNVADVELQDQSKLMKTSMVTAAAIALHNFPEGLATFVSTLADPKLGVSIAIAIAIHNIPEGVSVAVPIYFATGSKLKSFMYAFLSGIAEPIGGLVGYLIIESMFSGAVFGVLFGFTGGVMIYISFKELLPTARSRDKQDKYSTILVFVGFLVMDISLLLFEYTF